MRHPFAGIIGPDHQTADRKVEADASHTTRRGFFGLVAGAAGAVTVGGAALLGLTAKAEAQATTLALGEEGGRRRPVATTRAIGEEGGRRPVYTTRAIGEEGGRPPVYTTRAWGEEGGATTRAIGEEGGRPGWKRWK